MRVSMGLGASCLLLFLGGCAAGGNTPAGDGGTTDTGASDAYAADVVITGDGQVVLPDGNIVPADGAPTDATSSFDGSGFDPDGGMRTPPTRDPDVFFRNDPPPRVCNRDGTMGPPAVLPVCDQWQDFDEASGVCECEAEKRQQGCPCNAEDIGETGPCWTGRRADRGRGQCMDGVARCEPYDEFSGQWGACEGETLPQESQVTCTSPTDCPAGATCDDGQCSEGIRAAGAPGCGCFSAGRWRLENTSPCFVGYNSACQLIDSCITGAVSTTFSGGTVSCPPISCDAALAPAGVFSRNWLTVDCTGEFELRYVIKANATPGIRAPLVSENNRPTTDCEVGIAQTGSVWYETPNVEQQLPDLPGWLGMNWTCAQRFQSNGGYGEMQVRGRSLSCEAIGFPDGSDRGDWRVFNRTNYCSCDCNANPTRADCVGCRTGGSGGF